jgi:hypothetical protein
MRTALRRFNRLSDRHPVLSIALGLLVIVIFGLVFLPADPPNLGITIHARSST